MTSDAPLIALPHVVPLPESLDAVTAFEKLSALPHVLFLDSALRIAHLGRYSFVAADPFAFYRAPADGSDALAELARSLAKYSAATIPDLPPFQGGAAGLLSYDLGRSLERVPRPRYEEFDVPALAVGLYDVVLAFDHLHQRNYLISQGFPETDVARRAKRAQERAAYFLQHLESATKQARTSPHLSPTPHSSLAPQHSVGDLPQLTSNFSRTEYLAAARRAIEYIRAGDIFQVNLAQRLLHPASDDSRALYLRLRERNPATFAGYFDVGEYQIVSASPERFLSVRARQVEARPIKGTRQRSARPEADLYAGDDLLQSEKDRAENVMIVDLLRNDLSRVCTPQSVHVSQLCGLEVYQFVQHLVSVVSGNLGDEFTSVDVLRAAFPGGSITGAPKVRAMEIIAELEPTARGAYCGSLGYLGFDGAMDWSILIRTITAGRGWWQLPVGGGIVAQSDPEREYDETWHKAIGLLKALR